MKHGSQQANVKVAATATCPVEHKKAELKEHPVSPIAQSTTGRHPSEQQAQTHWQDACTLLGITSPWRGLIRVPASHSGSPIHTGDYEDTRHPSRGA